MRITIPGQPVPKARMTQASKWSVGARRSLDYQELIAAHAKYIHRINEPLDGDLSINLRFFRESNVRADWDNMAKSACDGLAYGRVIKNDKQIVDA